MAGPLIPRKWRPRLGLVVFAVLLSVLALPATVVIGFRALDHTTSQMGVIEGSALGVALLLTLVIAYVLTRTITGPIEALVQRAEAIGKGGRDAIRPLDSYGTREIATLAQSFLDLAAHLVDRSNYVQSFAAHVSHELKSPLTAVRGAAELLRDDDPDAPMTTEERNRFLDHIIADADRLNLLLGRLRQLAQADLPMAEGRVLLSEVVAALRRNLAGLDLVMRDDVEMPLPLEAASIILGHLADNAAQHGATQLNLAAEDDGRTLRLLVSDNGRGISAGNRERVFQPFFSTRREEGGTGMGLDIVRAMLGAHGGSIRLLDSEAGAHFEIMLPH